MSNLINPQISFNECLRLVKELLRLGKLMGAMFIKELNFHHVPEDIICNLRGEVERLPVPLSALEATINCPHEQAESNDVLRFISKLGDLARELLKIDIYCSRTEVLADRVTHKLQQVLASYHSDRELLAQTFSLAELLCAELLNAFGFLQEVRMYPAVV
jgi:hypothetical protein